MKLLAELPEVEGLRSNLVETLYNEGLTSAEAFATVTEEEVLALKGVGPATVKKLKEMVSALKLKPKKDPRCRLRIFYSLTW